MRVACPRHAIASIREDGSKVILAQRGLHAIRGHIPDFCEQGVAARKPASIIGRLHLADGTHARDMPRRADGVDREPGKAHTFVQFAVQLKPVGVAMLDRRLCFIGGRLVIFTDAHLDITGTIGAVEFNPRGAFATEVEQDHARGLDRYGGSRPCQGLQIIKGCRLISRNNLGRKQIDLQRVGYLRIVPAIGDQRVRRLRHCGSAETTVRDIAIRLFNRRPAIKYLCGKPRRRQHQGERHRTKRFINHDYLLFSL